MNAGKLFFGLWILVGTLPLGVQAQDAVDDAPPAERRAPPPRMGPRQGRPMRPPPGWRMPPRPPGPLPGPLPGPMMERLRNLPPEQREEILRNNRRFQQLPKEQQEKMLERFRRFQQLPPRQREMMEERFSILNSLTPERRRKALQIYERHWRDLPPERRQALTEEFRRLRELSPQERKLRLSSPELEDRFNSQERDLLQQLTAL